MVVAVAVDVVVVVAVDFVVVAVDFAAAAAEAAVAVVAAAAGAFFGAAAATEAAAYRGASAVFADPRRALRGFDKRRFFGRAREATRPILVRTTGTFALARPNSLTTSHPELLSTPVRKDIGATAGLALTLGPRTSCATQIARYPEPGLAQ
jgi:hypothetical protein